MKVFARYDPATSQLVRIWARSWMAHGWKPRLISAQEIEKHGAGDGAVLARTRGRGGVVTDVRLMNFAISPRKFKKYTSAAFGVPGWKEAGLVLFGPNATEDQVLNCGRKLKHADRRS